MKIPFGSPGEIPEVEVKVGIDEIENFFRKWGVVSMCEYFGHAPDSEFTQETINHLLESSAKELTVKK